MPLRNFDISASMSCLKECKPSCSVEQPQVIPYAINRKKKSNPKVAAPDPFLLGSTTNKSQGR